MPNAPAAITANPIVQFAMCPERQKEWTVSGTINAQYCNAIVRDSGCNTIVVSNKIVPTALENVTRYVKVQDYLGRIDTLPTSKVHIKCPYYEGWCEAILAPLPDQYVALIGNVPGARISPLPNIPFSLDSDSISEISQKLDSNNAPNAETVNIACAEINQNTANSESGKTITNKNETVSLDLNTKVVNVATRSQVLKNKAKLEPLNVPILNTLNIASEEFLKLQLTCPTLESLRKSEASNNIVTTRDGSQFQIIKAGQFYHRKCIYSKNKIQINQGALLVPECCREQV